MQKPFTIAVLGKGRSWSFWKTSQPARTNDRASAGVAKRVNASTSAPAMNDALAERTMRPLGESALIASKAADSSSSASREKVLVDSFCLSKVSHTRPCASCSKRQCL